MLRRLVVTTLRLARLGLQGLFCCVGSSCSLFLPAHSKSEAVNESRVEVEFVTFATLEKPEKPEHFSFKEDYQKVFGSVDGPQGPGA
jgi:hypothetical protein